MTTAPTPPSAPNEAAQRSFWNAWDTQYRDGKEMDALDAATKRRGRTVLAWMDTLGLPRTVHILEVGCANGWLSEHLARYGQVTATDLADEVVARAQARFPHIRFVAGDFMTIALPRSGFDVIVCLETLSCVADQTGFVGRFAELLKPGGYLLLTTHNRFVYERSEDVAPQQPGQVRHWLYWRELKNLLRRHFRIRRHTTLAPTGHRGLLRLVNSYRLAALLAVFLSPDQIDQIRERMGFGQTHAVLAQAHTEGVRSA